MPHRDEQIVIFQHREFRGHHRHIFGFEANLSDAADSSLNDAVSSLVIVSGNWRFFKHANFQEPYPPTLGPGEYTWVGDFGIENDNITSLRAV
jgi:hypothetical protein